MLVQPVLTPFVGTGRKGHLIAGEKQKITSLSKGDRLLAQT